MIPKGRKAIHVFLTMKKRISIGASTATVFIKYAQRLGIINARRKEPSLIIHITTVRRFAAAIRRRIGNMYISKFSFLSDSLNRIEKLLPFVSSRIAIEYIITRICDKFKVRRNKAYKIVNLFTKMQKAEKWGKNTKFGNKKV